jgi:hypothetical protein
LAPPVAGSANWRRVNPIRNGSAEKRAEIASQVIIIITLSDRDGLEILLFKYLDEQQDWMGQRAFSDLYRNFPA